MQEVKIHTR